jgi:hypothetical protein
MSFAITRTNGDGSTDSFVIGFSYRDEADLIVKVNGVTQTLNTHFKVRTGGTIIDFSQGSSPLGIPPNGHSVFISRATSQTSRLVDYAAGSVFKEADLDTDSEQGFFMAQEAIDIANESITVDANNNWDADNKRIVNVADPVNNQDAVNKQFISSNLPNINTVSGISSDVTTVAGIASNVTTVAADQADIGTVSSNIASVNTVATNIADVVTVANDLNEAISEIETAANDLNEATSEIDTVANAIANVNTVGTNISNVNTVAGVSSDVTTVAGNNANVSTVAGISGDVTTVAGIQANVTTVAGDATDIGTVATDLAGTDTIGTVAGSITNVNTVAGNNTNINTVAGVSSDVTTVAGISSNVSTVATNNANVTAVAGNTTNINTVAGAATNINTVVSNLTNVNNFADTYFISATAPANPTQGDLWFDTDPASLVMKVYDGSGFVNAGSSVNGTSNRTTYTATAGQTSFAATYDAGFVDVYLNGVKLINGTDFTATNGSTVVLTTGAAVNDTVDIVGYGTFELQNTSLDDLSDVSSASASTGQFLKWNGTNWVGDTVSTDLVADTTPQLGGNLDLNSNNITGTGNISTTGTATFSASSQTPVRITSSNTASFIEMGDSTGSIRFGTSSSGDMTFHTGGDAAYGGEAKVMTLDSNGLLGIGTATPNRTLTVEASTGTVADFTSTGTSGGGITLGDANTTAGFNRIRGVGDDMYFYTSGNNERMRIQADGDIVVGTGSTISGSTQFTILGESDGRAADTYRQSTSSTNHIQNWYSDVGGTRNIQAVIEAGGDVESRTNNFTGTSDRTLKENITDANSQWDDIKALQVKNYNFIGEPERTCIGVIAQDVEAAGMTGLVKTSDETGKMSVKYSVLYMKAIKALQEAMQKIEDLETRVAELEAN